jgi:hypothetical protein
MKLSSITYMYDDVLSVDGNFLNSIITLQDSDISYLYNYPFSFEKDENGIITLQHNIN